jgi:hypothetical protein
MPIVVKKGSDASRKKAIAKKALNDANRPRTPDGPETVDVSNIATDMTDILDFKVYRIIKPNFYSKNTRVSLIGADLFYKDEENTVKLSANDTVVDSGTSTHTKAEIVAPETIYEKIYKLKNGSCRSPRYKNELFARASEAHKTTLMLKAGHSIHPYLLPTTFEDTLKWALNNLDHDNDMTSSVLKLYFDLRSYEEMYVMLCCNVFPFTALYSLYLHGVYFLLLFSA